MTAGISPETEVSFLPMENIGEDGTFSDEERRSLEEVAEGYTHFRDGDVGLAKITPCFENGKGALFDGLENGIGFGTTELHILRAKSGTSPRYVFYLTRSHLFRKLGAASMYGSAGQKRVPEDFVRDFTVGFPPFSEQRAIAAFLDRETAKIDALIGKQERLIELLEEKRAALISHAVTKGLDPDVPMKNSGIPWLGEIPEHWSIGSVKWLFTFLDSRRIPLSAEERAGMQGPYPYYGASGIIDYVDDYLFDEALILVAEDGANLLSRSSPLAFIARGKYWVNNHAHVVRPHDGLVTYWVYPLQVVDYDPWITGSAQPKLNQENLGSIYLPVPPVKERRVIASYLDRETAKIDGLIDKAHTMIERLQEYRTALVSAAVTGKIDVRERAPG
jgi:type I restriction enzyme S subunit